MELNDVQKEADSAVRKAMLFGVFALGFAIFVGWVLARLSGGGPQTQQVVVAAHRIAPLTQLKVEDLRLVEWPIQSLPEGTFARPDDVIKLNELNLGGLLSGEPVLKERLSTPERGLGMSQMVEANKRAFVVQVQDSVATSEILHPGAMVDVIATLTDEKTHSVVSKLLLQNVQVLAVGDSIDVERVAPTEPGKQMEIDRNKTERHRVVTLQIGAADVELMTFASRYGQFDLVLRNNNDAEQMQTLGVNMDKIMGRDKRSAVAAPSAAQPAAAAPEGDTPSAPAHRRPNRGGGHRSPRGSEGPSIINIDH